MIKPPNSRVNLDKAIERLFGNYERGTEVRSIMANTIVGQLLPAGVVKGGTSLKLRYGNQCTRMTTDFDLACKGAVSSFVDELARWLSEGWGDFTGTIVRRTPAAPRDVPAEYVMKPFGVKLFYKGQSWCTIDLELGFNEIGDADEADYCLSDEVLEIFSKLGLPLPKPIPLMKLEYQIAQKLHGATEPGSRRAHDLIDLQLILAKTKIDLARTNAICQRLFAFRRMQPWPSFVTRGPDWQSIYEEERPAVGILPGVDAAISWTNNLIRLIADASTPSNDTNVN